MAVEELAISDPPITLGQLLKLAGVAGSGSEAKAVLAQQTVLVNDTPETRRGRKLRDGDVVRVEDRELRVSAPPEGA